MKTIPSTLAVLILALPILRTQAQNFTSGSDGSYGPMNITSNTTLNLPADGIFHCTTINVAAGATLRFITNALNTPVYLLAQSNVTISGTIDVSGTAGTSNPPIGGKGGPGGFDGGMPGFDTAPPGAGHGPGGGRGGISGSATNSVGSGSYRSVGQNSFSTNRGAAYGSPLLVPLVGGSGGGGTPGAPGLGGNGGGGAILIASSTRITVSGGIVSRGGDDSQETFRNGSGGAIRLVAPVVSGSGALNVHGGGPLNPTRGGFGRIRIDTIDRTSLQLTYPLVQASIGSFMAVFPTPLPRLDILQAADTDIPEGNPAPVQIQLPFGSTTNRTVTVQARDFNAQVPVNVVLTPDSGRPQVYPVTIDNVTANPATITVPVTLPVNTLITVNAWTR